MTNPGGPASTNSGTSRARTGTVTVVSQYAPATSMVPTKATKKAIEPSAPRLAGVEAYYQPPANSTPLSGNSAFWMKPEALVKLSADGWKPTIKYMNSAITSSTPATMAANPPKWIRVEDDAKFSPRNTSY